MKKIVMLGVALAVLAGGTWAYAEFKRDWQEHENKRIERLTTELNLTADQQAKIRAVFDGMHVKMKALKEETQKKVASVLTADQKVKFEEMKERHREHRQSE